jgi:PadR family transcriptional regulator, regulatory protein PadR
MKTGTNSTISENEIYTLRFYTSFAIRVEERGVTVKEKSDLPQGTLDLLILKVVALGPVHGYAIAQRLQQVSRDVVQVPQGSLYPALHRLENRGLLAADWNETETGREAKFYKLTRKGRAQLETETASWERLAEAVGLIMKLSPEGAE